MSANVISFNTNNTASSNGYNLLTLDQLHALDVNNTLMGDSLLEKTVDSYPEFFSIDGNTPVISDDVIYSYLYYLAQALYEIFYNNLIDKDFKIYCKCEKFGDVLDLRVDLPSLYHILGISSLDFSKDSILYDLTDYEHNRDAEKCFKELYYKLYTTVLFSSSPRALNRLINQIRTDSSTYVPNFLRTAIKCADFSRQFDISHNDWIFFEDTDSGRRASRMFGTKRGQVSKIDGERVMSFYLVNQNPIASSSRRKMIELVLSPMTAIKENGSMKSLPIGSRICRLKSNMDITEDEYIKILRGDSVRIHGSVVSPKRRELIPNSSILASLNKTSADVKKLYIDEHIVSRNDELIMYPYSFKIEDFRVNEIVSSVRTVLEFKELIKELKSIENKDSDKINEDKEILKQLATIIEEQLKTVSLEKVNSSDDKFLHDIFDVLKEECPELIDSDLLVPELLSTYDILYGTIKTPLEERKRILIEKDVINSFVFFENEVISLMNELGINISVNLADRDYDFADVLEKLIDTLDEASYDSYDSVSDIFNAHLVESINSNSSIVGLFDTSLIANYNEDDLEYLELFLKIKGYQSILKAYKELDLNNIFNDSRIDECLTRVIQKENERSQSKRRSIDDLRAVAKQALLIEYENKIKPLMLLLKAVYNIQYSRKEKTIVNG